MTAKQSTATKEARKQASAVSDFKKLKKGRPLTLPSGLTMVCKRVELSSFIRQGDVPNPLLPIIEDALNKGKEMDMSKIVNDDQGKVDMDMVNSMYEMVNTIVCAVAISPSVHPIIDEDGDEIDEDDRDDNLLYVDEVDDEDKMFLFGWAVGGTEDVATFRREAETGLASLGKKQGSGKKSKRTDRP